MVGVFLGFLTMPALLLLRCYSSCLSLSRCTSRGQRRTKKDWAYFIEELLTEHYPRASKVVLVMDNLNTHSPASLYDTFPPEKAKGLLDRLEIHYTPKHASWLNIAEIELSVLARQGLEHNIATVDELCEQVQDWQTYRNQQMATVHWQFT